MIAASESSMACPMCGTRALRVTDSRPTEDSAMIRRRRLCGGCGGRITTLEMPAATARAQREHENFLLLLQQLAAPDKAMVLLFMQRLLWRPPLPVAGNDNPEVCDAP
jgi:hypothetical protein